MTFFKYSLVIIAIAFSVFSNAIELGEMTFESRFGDPFKAQIDVPNVGNIDTQNLRVRIAPWQTWRSLDISRSTYIDDVDVGLIVDSNSDVKILVDSKRRLNEPYIDLLIELRWPSGTLLKHYIVLVPMGLEIPPVSDNSFSRISQTTSSPSTSTNSRNSGSEQENTASISTSGVISDENLPVKSETVSDVQNTEQNSSSVQEAALESSQQSSVSESRENRNSQITEYPEFGRLYITKENDKLDSIAEQLNHPSLSIEEVADTLFDYNFYVTSRNRSLEQGISIEIPDENAFQPREEPSVSFSEDITVNIEPASSVNGSNLPKEEISASSNDSNIAVVTSDIAVVTNETNISSEAASVDLSQVIRDVPGVESSIARFTPTERAETRIRALGFASAQQRIEGNQPNQWVTGGGSTPLIV